MTDMETLQERLSANDDAISLPKVDDIIDFLTSSKLPEYVEYTIPEVSNWSADTTNLNNKIRDLSQSDLTENDIRIITAVTLWTNGAIEVVRNPSLFKKEHIEEIYGTRFKNGFIWTLKKPTKKDYESANEIVKSLAAAPCKGKIVYRGIGLKPDVAKELKVGVVLDLGEISSFSFDSSVAYRFVDKARQEGLMPVFIVLNKPKRGTAIDNISHFYEEGEFVTSGKIRITSIKSGASFDKITTEQL